MVHFEVFISLMVGLHSIYKYGDIYLGTLNRLVFLVWGSIPFRRNALCYKIESKLVCLHTRLINTKGILLFRECLLALGMTMPLNLKHPLFEVGLVTGMLGLGREICSA